MPPTYTINKRFKKPDPVLDPALASDLNANFDLVDLGFQQLTFNVKDARFGAVGDGVTDDATAIRAAVAAAVAAGGGVLYLPPGTYKLGSSIAVDNGNVVVQGAGPGTVVIPPAGSHAFTTGVGQAVGFSCSLFAFRDFAVTGGWGFWKQRNEASEFSIARVFCTGQAANVIETSAVERFTFEDCYFQGGGQHGWLANQYDTPLSTQAPRTQRFNVRRCTWSQFTDRGVYFQNLAAAGNPDGLGSAFQSCTFLFNQKEALVIDSINGCVFSGCSLEAAGGLANNTYDGFSIAPTGAGATIQSVVLAGCVFNTNGLANQARYGLTLTASASCVVEGCTAQGVTLGFNLGGAVDVRNCNGTGVAANTTNSAAGDLAVGRNATVAGSLTLTGNEIISANAAEQLRFKDIAALANNGTALVGWAGGTITGLLFVIDRTNNTCAAVLLRGAAGATALVFDPGSVYSVASGTAAHTNVYWSAGNTRYEIENKTGGAVNYSVFFMATA